MTPRDKNIYSTVNVLCMLFDARKIVPNLSDEQSHTLTVSKEHLTDADISVPVFVNTLKVLDEKGYLFGVSTFGQEARDELKKLQSNPEYEKILSELDKIDLSGFESEAKNMMSQVISKRMPPGCEFDHDEFMKESGDFKEWLTNAKEALREMNDETISTVVLMPFRSIERLLEKMNSGIKFDDIKDPGIWYENDNGAFHFDEQTVSTQHNRKRYVHYALQALFNQFENNEIDYVDIPEFDDSKGMEKEMKSFRDALSGFIKKEDRLKEIFTVHSTHLEIHEEPIA
jgi:hypothetical protein